MNISGSSGCNALARVVTDMTPSQGSEQSVLNQISPA